MNEVAYAKNQFLVWLELMRIAARALEKKLHSDTKDYADYLRRLVDEGWAKEPNGSCQVISMQFRDTEMADYIRNELVKEGVPVMTDLALPETLVIPQSCYEKMQRILSEHQLSNNLEQYKTQEEFEQIHRELIDSKKLFNSNTVKDKEGHVVVELTPIDGIGNCTAEDSKMLESILKAHGIHYQAVQKGDQTAIQIPYSERPVLDMLMVSNGYDICYNDPKPLDIAFDANKEQITISEPEDRGNLYEFEAYLHERGFNYQYDKEAGKIVINAADPTNKDLLCEMSDQARQRYGFSSLEADFNCAFGVVRGERNPSGAGQFAFTNKNVRDKSFEQWIDPEYQNWAENLERQVLANSTIDYSKIPEKVVVSRDLKSLRDQIAKDFAATKDTVNGFKETFAGEIGEQIIRSSEKQNKRLNAILDRAEEHSRHFFNESDDDKNHILHVRGEFLRTLAQDPEMREFLKEDYFKRQAKSLKNTVSGHFDDIINSHEIKLKDKSLSIEEYDYVKGELKKEKTLKRFFESRAKQLVSDCTEAKRIHGVRDDNAKEYQKIEEQAAKGETGLEEPVCKDGFENYAYQCFKIERDNAEARLTQARLDVEEARANGRVDALIEANDAFEKAKHQYDIATERLDRGVLDTEVQQALKQLDITTDPREAADCAAFLAKSESAMVLFQNPTFYSYLKTHVEVLADKDIDSRMEPCLEEYSKGAITESELRKEASRIISDCYTRTRDARIHMDECRDMAKMVAKSREVAREETRLQYQIADVAYDHEGDSQDRLAAMVQARQDKLDNDLEKAKSEFMSLSSEEQQAQWDRVDAISNEYINNSSALKQSACVTADYLARLDKAATVGMAAGVLSEMSKSPEVRSVTDSFFWNGKKIELEQSVAAYVAVQKEQIANSNLSPEDKAKFESLVDQKAEKTLKQIDLAVNEAIKELQAVEKAEKDAEFEDAAQDSRDLHEAVAFKDEEEELEDEVEREFGGIFDEEPSEKDEDERKETPEEEVAPEEEVEEQIDRKAINSAKSRAANAEFDRERINRANKNELDKNEELRKNAEKQAAADRERLQKEVEEANRKLAEAQEQERRTREEADRAAAREAEALVAANEAQKSLDNARHEAELAEQAAKGYAESGNTEAAKVAEEKAEQLKEQVNAAQDNLTAAQNAVKDAGYQVEQSRTEIIKAQEATEVAKTEQSHTESNYQKLEDSINNGTYLTSYLDNENAKAEKTEFDKSVDKAMATAVANEGTYDPYKNSLYTSGAYGDTTPISDSLAKNQQDAYNKAQDDFKAAETAKKEAEQNERDAITALNEARRYEAGSVQGLAEAQNNLLSADREYKEQEKLVAFYEDKGDNSGAEEARQRLEELDRQNREAQAALDSARINLKEAEQKREAAAAEVTRAQEETAAAQTSLIYAQENKERLESQFASGTFTETAKEEKAAAPSSSFGATPSPDKQTNPFDEQYKNTSQSMGFTGGEQTHSYGSPTTPNSTTGTTGDTSNNSGSTGGDISTSGTAIWEKTQERAAKEAAERKEETGYTPQGVSDVTSPEQTYRDIHKKDTTQTTNAGGSILTSGFGLSSSGGDGASTGGSSGGSSGGSGSFSSTSGGSSATSRTAAWEEAQRRQHQENGSDYKPTYMTEREAAGSVAPAETSVPHVTSHTPTSSTYSYKDSTPSAGVSSAGGTTTSRVGGGIAAAAGVGAVAFSDPFKKAEEYRVANNAKEAASSAYTATFNRKDTSPSTSYYESAQKEQQRASEERRRQIMTERRETADTESSSRADRWHANYQTSVDWKKELDQSKLDELKQSSDLMRMRTAQAAMEHVSKRPNISASQYETAKLHVREAEDNYSRIKSSVRVTEQKQAANEARLAGLLANGNVKDEKRAAEIDKLIKSIQGQDKTLRDLAKQQNDTDAKYNKAKKMVSDYEAAKKAGSDSNHVVYSSAMAKLDHNDLFEQKCKLDEMEKKRSELKQMAKESIKSSTKAFANINDLKKALSEGKITQAEYEQKLKEALAHRNLAKDVHDRARSELRTTDQNLMMAQLKYNQIVKSMEASSQYGKTLKMISKEGEKMEGLLGADGKLARVKVLGNGNTIREKDVVINLDDDFHISRKTYAEKHEQWSRLINLAKKPIEDGFRKTDTYQGYRTVGFDVIAAGLKASAMNAAHELARMNSVDMFNKKTMRFNDKDLASFHMGKEFTVRTHTGKDGKISYSAMTDDMVKVFDLVDRKAALLGFKEWNGMKSLSQIVKNGSLQEYLRSMQGVMSQEKIAALKELGEFQHLAMRAGGFDFINAGDKLMNALGYRIMDGLLSWTDDNDAARVMRSGVQKYKTVKRSVDTIKKGMKRIHEINSEKEVYLQQARAVNDALRGKLTELKTNLAKGIKNVRNLPQNIANAPKNIKKNASRVLQGRRANSRKRRAINHVKRETPSDTVHYIRSTGRNLRTMLKGSSKDFGQGLISGVRGNIAGRLERARKYLANLKEAGKIAKIGFTRPSNYMFALKHGSKAAHMLAAKGAAAGATGAAGASAASGAAGAAGAAAGAAGGGAVGGGLVAGIVAAAPIIAAICVILTLISFILICIEEVIIAAAGMKPVVENPYTDTYQGVNVMVASGMDTMLWEGTVAICGMADTIDELFSWVPFYKGVKNGALNIAANGYSDPSVYIKATGVKTSGGVAVLNVEDPLGFYSRYYSYHKLGTTKSGWHGTANTEVLVQTEVKFYDNFDFTKTQEPDPDNPDGPDIDVYSDGAPVYKTTVSTLYPVNEGLQLIFADGKGNVSARTSNVKQILSMTAVVFTDVTAASDNAIAVSKNAAKHNPVIENIAKLKTEMNKIKESVYGWEVQIFETFTHIDIPETYFNSEQYVQTSYVIAAYLASHEMYITYNVDSDDHIIGLNCWDLVHLPGTRITGLGSNSIEAAACVHDEGRPIDDFHVWVEKKELEIEHFHSDDHSDRSPGNLTIEKKTIKYWKEAGPYDSDEDIASKALYDTTDLHWYVGYPTTNGMEWMAQVDYCYGGFPEGKIEGCFCAGHPTMSIALKTYTFDTGLFELIENCNVCHLMESIMEADVPSFFSDSWECDADGNLLPHPEHWTPFNRDWARRLYDRDWWQDYKIRISNTIGFTCDPQHMLNATADINGIYRNQDTQMNMYFLSQDERMNILTQIGRDALSYERYMLIYDALRMCGQVTFGDTAGGVKISHPEKYIDYSGVNGYETDVKRDEAGEPIYPDCLNSPEFVTWLFAANRMDITGSKKADWGYGNYYMNSGAGGRIEKINTWNAAPGDVVIANSGAGSGILNNTVGIFLGWQGSNNYAYVLMCYGLSYAQSNTPVGMARVVRVQMNDFIVGRPNCYTEEPYPGLGYNHPIGDMPYHNSITPSGP